MGSYLQILALAVTGAILLWFGYSLYFGSGKRLFARHSQNHAGRRQGSIAPKKEGVPGDPQICPVCSAKLEKGELIKSSAFPSLNGKDRLMHIRGCTYCLEGRRRRVCPVCGAVLDHNEILVARIYERPRPSRPHVHVFGCSRCKR
jgi:hypothetical protein